MTAVNQELARHGDEERLDGELTVQAFGPGARVLCGVLAAGHLAYVGAMLMGAEPLNAVRAVMAVLLTVPLSVIAAFGWSIMVTDPLGSERFLELADPARPLTAEDFAAKAPGLRSASADTKGLPARVEGDGRDS